MTDDGGATVVFDVPTTDVGWESECESGIWSLRERDEVRGAAGDDLLSRDLPCEDPSSRDLSLTLALLFVDFSR